MISKMMKRKRKKKTASAITSASIRADLEDPDPIRRLTLTGWAVVVAATVFALAAIGIAYSSREPHADCISLCLGVVSAAGFYIFFALFAVLDAIGGRR